MKKIKLFALGLGMLLFSQANATIPCAANLVTVPAESVTPVSPAIGGTKYGQTFIPTKSGLISSITIKLSSTSSSPVIGGVLDVGGNSLGESVAFVSSSGFTESVTFSFSEPFQVYANNNYAFAFQVLGAGVTIFGGDSSNYPQGTAGQYFSETEYSLLPFDFYIDVCFSELGGSEPPSALTIKLSEQSCGRVMQSRDESIVAEEVSGAESYRFKIFDLVSSTQVFEKIQSSKSLEYKNVAQYVTPATQYYVFVSVKVDGEWTQLGEPCSITTPGADQGVILNCGQTYTSWNQVVKAEVQSGADRYQFIFNNGGGNIVYASSRPFVKLRNVNLTGNSTYSVKVRVRKNGVFGQATEDCSITTPSGSPTREGDAFVNADQAIFMFPNPAEGDYVYLTNTIHNVEIFDAVGNIVSTQAQADLINVSELSAGMYIVKSDEGLVKLMVK